jgi:hypothetical protein
MMWFVVTFLVLQGHQMVFVNEVPFATRAECQAAIAAHPPPGDDVPGFTAREVCAGNNAVLAELRNPRHWRQK